ncbi:hypothetical protein [Salininema proteolyticum]|uniref:Uncharacterized protein n=1 Tax=Salininema proteolyticum TaxID=1607685 RepID=A0ABV8TT63_9ACTN
MPGDFHETLVGVVHDCPSLGFDLLRASVADRYKGTCVKAEAVTESVNHRNTAERRADNVLKYTFENGAELVTILEIQNRWDEDKYYRLPAYVANAFENHKCAIELVVVCPNDALAMRYRGGVSINPEFYMPIHGIGPADIPLFTDPEDPCARPETAVFAALAHRKRDLDQVHISTIDSLLRKIEPVRSRDYAQALLSFLTQPSCDLLEAIMKTMTAPYHSEWSDSLRQEGQVSEARGSILQILELRRVSLTEAQQRAIEACDDISALRQWLKNALTAASADELFAEHTNETGTP